MKKNIAILIGDISRSAGTERAVTNLANMLVKHGEYNVTILSCFSTDDMEPYYELENRVEVCHFSLTKRTIIERFISYTKIITKTNKILKEKSIDILLGTTHAFNCLMMCMSRKVKKIACEHMSYEACPLYSRVIRFFVYPFLSSVVLLSEEDRKKYFFIKKNKTIVIENSLSFVPSSIAPLREKIMVAIGRLSRLKGFDYLLESMIEVKKAIPDWHLNIFGDGEEKRNLETIIEKNNLNDYVSMLPPKKNIEKELINSSLFIMTSRTEGLPMVLLESKVCGVPVVSFKSSKTLMSLIENEVDGYLVNCGNIKDLANKIISLAKNYELRKKIGANARISSEKYLPESIFLKWDNLFKNI